MNYSITFLKDFINKLSEYTRKCDELYDSYKDKEKDTNFQYETEKETVSNNINKAFRDIYGDYSDFDIFYESDMNKEYSRDVEKKQCFFERLRKCNACLSTINVAQQSIKLKPSKKKLAKSTNSGVSISVDMIIDGKINFASKANDIKSMINEGKRRKKIYAEYASFTTLCETGKEMLSKEIALLRENIVKNLSEVQNSYSSIEHEYANAYREKWNDINSLTGNISYDKAQDFIALDKKSAKDIANCRESFIRDLIKLDKEFFDCFPPRTLLEEYLRINSMEPSFDSYECISEMPINVQIGNLHYDVDSLDKQGHIDKVLRDSYGFMYDGKSLLIPYSLAFGQDFNCLFQFSDDNRELVVKDACDFGMSLFMHMPPSKLNFTFVDPVKLGGSFAIFNRLVNTDDRTSEIINGKIWSAPSDIEEKLRVMTDHISNITQRCLQGKYPNIYEYNKVAEQNAEPYQVIMLMDYPAGLSEKALRMLEQIVASGPKCGVFTVIYRNEDQYSKIPEKVYPLIDNIESNLWRFKYNGRAEYSNHMITYCNEQINGEDIGFTTGSVPTTEELDKIIEALKDGIKNAEKVVIGIDKFDNAKTSDSTINGIRIPIGVHGANELQYFTLGVGGSHHALIAGVAGSGKSSLLHTIILRSLTQYNPDELQIYLVDFKRGVEFKIYADYELPSFKVVAIESEREFGYNILMALEREQRIRADKFKRKNVDKIEEYREYVPNDKMPRILVVMDEFHELFSNGNDEISRKSAVIMERIVRQGRAFGIHLILASQSYSNITGVDKSVFDQMAVRIVLKCSKTDANLLLDQGSSEIDQISIDDPGRAVYNSEAGNKEYNSHFRVAYINPKEHGKLLEDISNRTIRFKKDDEPTRILLSNIEDNKYSIFNRFDSMTSDAIDSLGRIYIGEPLNTSNNLPMVFNRNVNSNMLMIGSDTDKARNMFAFAILSLCINYWVKYKKIPDKPFITLINCKPLDDTYFKDMPKEIAMQLQAYITYITCGETQKIENTLTNLYDSMRKNSCGDIDQYLFVFAYQRADELKSEIKPKQEDDINDLFNINTGSSDSKAISPKNKFMKIIKDGPENGIHTFIWQDSFSALFQEDKDFVSYFAMKIGFDMSADDYSRFIGANDTSTMNENNAIYYNRTRDNQKFRPYQTPDIEWITKKTELLNQSNNNK